MTTLCDNFFCLGVIFHPSRDYESIGMIFLNTYIQSKSSIEETEDLATDVTVTGFIMGKHSLVCGNHQMSELSGRQDAVGPLLEISQCQIISGRNNPAFVDSTDQFDDNLL